MDIFQYAFKVITAPELQRSLLPIKIIVFVFSFIVLGLIVYWFLATSYKDYLFLDKWRDWQHWKKNRQEKIKRFKRKKAEEKIEFKQKREKDNAEKEESNSKIKEEEEIFKQDRDKFVEKQKMGEWERVLEKLKSKKELNYKLAFIDADRILNEVLKKKKEKLSLKAVSNNTEILKAKEVLEKMLARPEAKLTLKRAEELIGAYRKALSELKAI